MDNLFVFILVFSYFKTPVDYQSKVCVGGGGGSLPRSLDSCTPHGTTKCLHWHMCSWHLVGGVMAVGQELTPLACCPLQVLTYGIATAAILRLVLIVAGVDIGESGGGGGSDSDSVWQCAVLSCCRGRSPWGGSWYPRPQHSTALLHAAALVPPCPVCHPAMAAVERFTPMLLLFAGILIYSSYKLLA